MRPTALTIDGASIALEDVAADVTIRHGRADVYDAATPSTLQATLLDVGHAYTRPFRVGADLRLDALIGDEQTPDVIPNGGAEHGLTGWQAQGVGTVLTVDSARARTGGHSFRATGATASYMGLMSSVPVQLKADRRYRFSAWVWAEGAVVGQIATIILYTPAAATWTGMGRTLTPGWNLITVDTPLTPAAWLLPANYVQVYINAAVPADKLWVDGIALVELPTLIVNGGAESGVLAPWTAFTSTAVVDPTAGHTGPNSFRIDATGAYPGIQQGMGWTAGEVYDIEAWFYAAGPIVGRTATLIAYYGGATAYYVQAVLVAGWNRLAGTTPPAVGGGAIQCYLVGGAAGDRFWVDDVSATPRPLPRFTGKVTDAELDGDRLTVIAVGRLATLSQYEVGAGDWPAETWSARVNRIFAEAGLTAYLELVNPPLAGDPQLAARVSASDGGAKPLDGYLGELANMIGAAVADRPDGRILVQPISARTLATRYSLDPADVLYVPPWIQVLPAGNVVTVKYAGGEVTRQDDGSVAFYGPRPVEIQTTFTDPAAATARAQERLARTAYSHWNILSAPILVGLPLSIGQAVELAGMPAPSPFHDWTPILEGWQDAIASDGRELVWTMELALSDPLASGLTLPWNAVPTSESWSTINQSVAWKDALTLEDVL